MLIILGIAILIYAALCFINNGVRVYKLEEGLKVRIQDSGRLRISIRQGVNIKSVVKFRKELVKVLAIYDSRRYSKQDVIISLLGGVVFIMDGLLF